MQTSPYDLIGGEPTVRRLTRRFYELMDELPEAAACRAIHKPSLAATEQKLYEYLTGWLGGPPLFTDKYGHPMLRARHLPFTIGEAEIDGWLACFTRAWAEAVPPGPLADTIFARVHDLARHMRNKVDNT
ncbi:group II truncated hemoglobin [Oleomonas cavernae]|nr:group II truncated hemoglobin [Oleomonas cavernae]